MTAKEKRIALSLGALVAGFATVYGLVNLPWKETAQVAPAITMLIALVAAIIAGVGISVQWNMARRRAAVDIFLRTETDEKMIIAYDKYLEGIEKFKQTTPPIFCENPNYKEHYDAVKKYLNVHELIAVGIATRMLDDRTCFEYWGSILVGTYEDCKTLIDHIHEDPEDKHTYTALVSRAKLWKAQYEKLAKVGG